MAGRSSRATLKLEDQTLVLDQLIGAATFDPAFGTSVRWTDGEGLVLTYFGPPDEEIPFDENEEVAVVAPLVPPPAPTPAASDDDSIDWAASARKLKGLLRDPLWRQ